MIDHLGIQVPDVDASVAFSKRVLAALGVREAMRYPGRRRRAPRSCTRRGSGPAENGRSHEGYHGVFFRDLDGHDVEAVCHR